MSITKASEFLRSGHPDLRATQLPRYRQSRIYARDGVELERATCVYRFEREHGDPHI